MKIALSHRGQVPESQCRYPAPTMELCGEGKELKHPHVHKWRDLPPLPTVLRPCLLAANRGMLSLCIMSQYTGVQASSTTVEVLRADSDVAINNNFRVRIDMQTLLLPRYSEDGIMQVSMITISDEGSMSCESETGGREYSQQELMQLVLLALFFNARDGRFHHWMISTSRRIKDTVKTR